MPRSFSPLRYPGGKSGLYHLVATILRLNELDRRPYAEPFAGGAGLALALLYDGHVSELHLNDIDPSIWAFWDTVLNRPDDIIEKVMTTDITVDEWRRQREIYLTENLSNPLDLGFAAFFLNRTNRSGIIKGAGVIGGLEQSGSYKIDCRFNREDLARRISRIAKYRRRIHLTRLDAVDFLSHADKILPRQSLLCIDPPYFNKGSSLYTSFYRAADHEYLSKCILSLDRPWIVTYDEAPEICALYRSQPLHRVEVNYSVQTKRVAGEILIAAESVDVPSTLERIPDIAS
ncbi:DNA adenine methylase [Paracoccus aerodenitrificans]|uniref:DNA adenine methylase n=1 Tax=Paracoccus aerodenitrificans TaxID=3017781 RepID=UPI0022EFEA25|nr:DNA adenine methylase [Paracoccus aerodenitrificans]WBU63594.1 DNA adenine methylase [Paracoccus aerodenitrificans]